MSQSISLDYGGSMVAGTDGGAVTGLSAAALQQGLRTVDYLADDRIAEVVYLADQLGKPILVEGPAGTGKTELAKSVARMLSLRLIRLQCHEGLDEAKAIYEWNYKKQLLRIQAQRVSGDEPTSWRDVEEDIFGEEFLLARPLLQSIMSPDRVVLLIDEVDRVEVETEALLLEVLSEWQVSVPELGTVTASSVPLVFLTSNSTRELSEALKRRCFYLYVDYPDSAREREIILARVPGIEDHLADQIARLVRLLRTLNLKKRPSVAETLDWARVLLLRGATEITQGELQDSLHILLKNRADIEAAKVALVDADVR